MHEERDEDDDNSVAASAAFTDASSHHHVTDTDAASSEQSIHETTLGEELERGNRNKKTGNEGGYEGLDPREVEEARLRAQQPSVYAGLRGDIQEATRDEELEKGNGNKKTGNGSGYEGLDPREVEEARLRAQQPSVYAGLRGDKLEDMYSVPKKKKR